MNSISRVSRTATARSVEDTSSMSTERLVMKPRVPFCVHLTGLKSAMLRVQMLRSLRWNMAGGSITVRSDGLKGSARVRFMHKKSSV